MKCTKILLMKKILTVISLMMFYELRDTIMVIVLVCVIYYILDICNCVDYLCLLRDNLSKHNKKLGKIEFNDFSGMRIPEMLMNFVSCCVFWKNQQTTVILACSGTLVSYVRSKLFLIVEK